MPQLLLKRSWRWIVTAVSNETNRSSDRSRRIGRPSLIAIGLAGIVFFQGPASADVPIAPGVPAPSESAKDATPRPSPLDIPPLSGPVAEIPMQDHLRSFATPPPLADGTLLYCEYVPKGSALRDGYHMGLVSRTSKENQQRPGACVTLYVEGIGQLFDPMLLPGGDRVLVKYGDYPGGDNLSRYEFYLMDLVTHRWKRAAPFDFVLPRVSVSLDGRFVAAVSGGDIRGQVARWSRPISLIVFDTVTGDSRVVLKDLDKAPTAAWMNQATLLFEAPEPPFHDSKGRPAGLDPSAPGFEPVPGIFEEPAMGGPRKLLMRHAFDPMPSPDGRWIVFRGWPDSPAALLEHMGFGENELGYPSRYLYDVAAKRRYAIDDNLVTGSDTLVWTPDSKRLLALRHDEPLSDESRACGVFAMDVGAGEAGVPRTAALLGTLQARSGGAFHGRSGGQFRPLRFVGGGRYLLVVKTENKGLNQYDYYDYEDALDALDLRTGEVWELARLYDDLEIDWSEKPLPAEAWTATKSAAK